MNETKWGMGWGSFLSRVARMLAMLVPLAAGCGYESPIPLSPATDARLDTRLLGRWQPSPPGVAGRELDVLPFNRHEILLVVADPEGIDRYRAFTSRVDGDEYLNVDPLEPDDASERYYFVRYRVEGATLIAEVVDDGLSSETIADAAALRATLHRKRDEPGTFRALVRLTRIPEEEREVSSMAISSNRIVYRYTDAPVLPDEQRNYTITVSDDRVSVEVQSGDTQISSRDRKLTPGEFDRLLELFRGCRIRRQQLGEDPSCAGGTSESISVRRAGETFSGTLYHCGGNDFGDLGGDLGRFVAALRALIPNFQALLRP